MSKASPHRAELPDGSRIERDYKLGDDGRPAPYGSWYWRVYDPDRRPKRKRVNLRTKDKGAAMRKALGLAQRRSLGAFDPWADAAPSGVTVASAAAEYVAAQERAGRASGTVGAARRMLDAFARSLPAACRVDHVERRHVAAFASAPKPDGSPKSPDTQRRYLAVLGHFFADAVARGYTRANPADGLDAPAGGAGRRDHVTDDEAGAVLRALDAAGVLSGQPSGWLRDWVVFGLGTGLRPGEQGGLRWSDVRLAEGAVRVRGTKTRGSARVVPVAGDALAVLQRLADARAGEGDALVFAGARGGAVAGRYLSKRLQALAETAGVQKNVTAYSLRHSYGTRMAAAGVPLLDLARIMGTSVQMIERHYGHYDPARGASHVARVFGAAGAGPSEPPPVPGRSGHNPGKTVRDPA